MNKLFLSWFTVVLLLSGCTQQQGEYNSANSSRPAETVIAPADAAAQPAANPGKIVVQVDKPGAKISPMFYGLMTEEINYSYEGGLYGELIQNRIFRNPQGGGLAPAVTGTKEPGLFRSEHYSMSSFSIKIPNGKYLAKLYFAETYGGITDTGQRVFSFNVQGHEFKDFDIWAKAGGPNRAYIETVPVEVTNGEFRIDFTSQIENPQINAIEIIPQAEAVTSAAPSAATLRIKAGLSTPLTDSSGQVWQPDKGFEGGDTIDRDPATEIAGTKDPGLFLSEHYAMSAFSCKIPNGKYLAKLYFAETYEGITGPGQRVFSYNVQGHEFKDFDIWAKAGGPNRAYVETVPVEVTNGEFRIDFTTQIENPEINAIEIIPQAEAETSAALSATTIRIKAGLFELFTDSSGQVWQPDKGFEGGDTVDHGPVVEAPTASIAGIPHWFVVTSSGAEGTAALDTNDPINTTALTTSLKLTISNVPNNGRVGVANDGYWGIPVKPNTAYRCSFYAKASDGFTGKLTVDIESNDGKTIYAAASVPAITDKWQHYKVTLKTGQVAPTADARFVISAGSKGTVNFNLVSLFPPVFKKRTGTALGGRPVTGFRPDIMQLLDDMHPAFLRFPGGNYVEGSNFANRFNWKIMIGPWEERPGHQSPWGYRSSDGLGLLEFLEWCEELNMEPVVGVYAGLHLDGGRDVRTGEALKPFIQDALDEIEYITGDVNTKWGALRAKDGHPAPFKLTYVEIGNEDFLNNGTRSYQGPEGRYAMFYNAIKAKYPDIQVIATVDPKVPHDVIDNHHYMSPNDAIRNAHLYDKADRSGPKIFEGEWASQERGAPRGLTPSFQCAISDAVFLTGLERNADIIIMNCYAPLFTRVNPGGNQWKTNLIGYDTLTSFGSPSYSVQKMFANAKGDRVIPVSEIVPQTIPTPASAPEPAPAPAGPFGRGRMDTPPSPNEPLFACASKEDRTGDIILKVVNIFDVEQNMTVELAGATVKKKAAGQVMVGQPNDINSVDDSFHTVPKDFVIKDASSAWNHTFPGNSITVIRFKTK